MASVSSFLSRARFSPPTCSSCSSSGAGQRRRHPASSCRPWPWEASRRCPSPASGASSCFFLLIWLFFLSLFSLSSFSLCLSISQDAEREEGIVRRAERGERSEERKEGARKLRREKEEKRRSVRLSQRLLRGNCFDSLHTLRRRRRRRRFARLLNVGLLSLFFQLPLSSLSPLPFSVLLAQEMSDSDFSEDEYVPKAKVRESSWRRREERIRFLCGANSDR